MIAILDELKEGSTKIGPSYQKCYEMWADVLVDAHELSIEELALRLDFQLKMERLCGRVFLGKTVMAVSGFHYLYSRDDASGGEQLAEKLLKAFHICGVSIEVTSVARRVAKDMFNITLQKGWMNK